MAVRDGLFLFFVSEFWCIGILTFLPSPFRYMSYLIDPINMPIFFGVVFGSALVCYSSGSVYVNMSDSNEESLSSSNFHSLAFLVSKICIADPVGFRV